MELFRAPQVIIIEPNLIRSFTCCKPPGASDASAYEAARVDRQDLQSTEPSLVQAVAQALHWVQFLSGQFFREHEPLFRREMRADHMLLSNLRSVREHLIAKAHLDEDICHDLLARVMFIQFLMDRKDSAGNAALDEDRLATLHHEGILAHKYTCLSDVLRNKGDAYAFFRYLDAKFNGDFFAGKDADGQEQIGKEERWQEEMRRVTPAHLKTLADFIDGRMKMMTGQLCLWKEYSFDVIPLEFISSIYEEFINSDAKSRGAHYTPGHLVDFMLDSVLPWGDTGWNLKVLDPACGSGIFLVKAYQRLIHRWKKAHPQERISVDDLRNLLTQNIFGVDINRHAVRVASFSLYLAMCDEIEPMSLWQRVRFPRLRNVRLLHADFFQDTLGGIRTDADAETFDLIIGNAPWGKNKVTEVAQRWASRKPDDIWPVPYGNPGPLFLAKAAVLARPDGQVCMVQPAQALLGNVQKRAVNFREKFFNRYKVLEITNLAFFRFGLFSNSISPACVVNFCPVPPDGSPVAYICPKPSRADEDRYRFVIEPHDVNHVFPHEAADDPDVWSTLLWGGRRDLALVRSLREKQTLQNLLAAGRIIKRGRVIRGDRKKEQPQIVGRRILDSSEMYEGPFLHVQARHLPLNKDPLTDRRASTDWTPFEVPQIIIKQSWESLGRFRSFWVVPDSDGKGVIFTRDYVSVHADPKMVTTLKSACAVYNSVLAVYYLFMTSGRCAAFIPNALAAR